MMTVSQVRIFLACHGYVPDTYGNMVRGALPRRVRFKFQQISVRIEAEYTVKDYYGKPATKWRRIGGGYLRNATIENNKLAFG